MSAANLDSANLQAVDFNGLIREDVMDAIFDISRIPLPLTDMISTESSENSYREWTVDRLNDPDVTNAQIDGADTTGNNDTNPDETGASTSDGEPSRQGNHHQISTKTVQVSTRSRNSGTIGRADELAYQLMMRQQELRRDVEAIMLTEQASRADTGALAGLSAGLGAWILTSFEGMGAGRVQAGFGSGVVTAPTPGTTGALSETSVRNVCESVYNEGGDPGYLMSIPSVIRKFSEYLFTSSARIAALYSDTGQAQEAVTAKGSVNVFVTDFGITLDLVPNRIMRAEVTTPGSERANAYIMDPNYLCISYLHGYQTEELAKTGLADKRQIAVDWTLAVKNQRAQGLLADIDYTAAAVA